MNTLTVIIPTIAHETSVNNLLELLSGLSSSDRRMVKFLIQYQGDLGLFSPVMRASEKRLISATFCPVSESRIGWLQATNQGLEMSDKKSIRVLMNDDVLVSENFFTNIAKILTSRPDIGVLAPCYNDIYQHQRSEGNYDGLPMGWLQAPVPLLRQVGFVDGTCMALNAGVDAVLHTEFLPSGWGADIDLCNEVKKTGKKIAVTEAAYLFHKKAETAKRIYGSITNYITSAGEDMDRAAIAKYGSIESFRLSSSILNG